VLVLSYIKPLLILIMSVPPFEFDTITNSKDKSKNEGDNSNLELSQLYKEGKEYTYLLSVSGTTNEHVVDVSPGFKNIVSAEVVQSHIPFTEYNIEEDRNTIVLDARNPALGGGTFTIELPVCNYTAETLIDTFNAIVTDTYSSPPNSLTMGSVRLNQEADTGRFFFYCDPPATPAADISIDKATTALYPLGISRSEKQYFKSSDLSNDSFQSHYHDGTGYKIRTTSGSITTTNYVQAVFCENRYDLSSTSDPLTITCEEIDRELKRGYNDKSVIPLAEIFLGITGGMDLNQKIVPDRPINPPLTLSRFTLRFNRPDRSNDGGNLRLYKFRGVRWYLKLAIKTLEMPSSIEGKSNTVKLEVTDDLKELTKGFGNHGVGVVGGPPAGRRVFQGPKQGVSSMMSTADEGTVVLPSAYNSGVYGRV